MPPMLLNRERATEVLSRAGLDALVLAQPLSVYYATSKPPVLDRMTTTHQSVAVVPADPGRPAGRAPPECGARPGRTGAPSEVGVDANTEVAACIAGRLRDDCVRTPRPGPEVLDVAVIDVPSLLRGIGIAAASEDGHAL